MAEKKAGWNEWTTRDAAALAVARAEFAAELRARREATRISQAELARRVNISPKTLNNIEYGHAWPSLPLYFALCRELKVGKIPLIS